MKWWQVEEVVAEQRRGINLERKRVSESWTKIVCCLMMDMNMDVNIEI